ncbi:MAG: hypothetical protein J6040_03845 [Clostridiales bacterium]|nr:hypothetical protein [Clostridiales bacterium]
MKQGKKLSSKAAGILTAVALIMSMASACTKSDETKESVTSGSQATESAADIIGDKEAEIVSEEADDAQSENEISDTQIWVSEPMGEEDEIEPTEESSADEEEPTQVVVEDAATVSVPTIEGHGRVLFTEEYTNYAWGRDIDIMAILEDGSVFLLGDDFYNVTGKIDDGFLSILLMNLEKLQTAETDVKVEDDYFSKLVALADAIDPDAKVTRKHVMCDYGQKAVYYWTEDGHRIRCLEYGDAEYTIDDPDAELFEEMWETIYVHFEAIS